MNSTGSNDQIQKYNMSYVVSKHYQAMVTVSIRVDSIRVIQVQRALYPVVPGMGYLPTSILEIADVKGDMTTGIHEEIHKKSAVLLPEE